MGTFVCARGLGKRGEGQSRSLLRRRLQCLVPHNLLHAQHINLAERFVFPALKYPAVPLSRKICNATRDGKSPVATWMWSLASHRSCEKLKSRTSGCDIDESNTWRLVKRRLRHAHEFTADPHRRPDPRGPCSLAYASDPSIIRRRPVDRASAPIQ